MAYSVDVALADVYITAMRTYLQGNGFETGCGVADVSQRLGGVALHGPVVVGLPAVGEVCCGHGLSFISFASGVLEPRTWAVFCLL